MGETVEGLAILARIPDRGRDDDGMEYGPHVVAAIRGEALASLGRYGEAADVVLDAVRSAGVLEADVGELVRWLLQAKRSPAEITASLSPEDLVPMLGRVLRQPPPLADVLLDGAWFGSPTVSNPWPRRPVWRPDCPWRGRWSGPPGCANEGWRRRARWWRSGSTARLILSSESGRRRRSTGRSEIPLPWTWRGPHSTNWTRPPGWLPKRRSAVSPLTCARRWRRSAARAARNPARRRRFEPRRARRPGRHRRVARSDRERHAPARITHRIGPVRSSRRRADHQARRPEHRRPVRGDQRRSRRGPADGERTPSEAACRSRRRRTTATQRDRGQPWSHRGPSDFPFDVNLLVVHPDQMTDFVLDSGPGLFRGSLHDRAVGLGPARALPVDGRRGPHGARSVDADVVGSRRCLIGARWATSFPSPSRSVGALPHGAAAARALGWARVRIRRRLRQRVRPAEPAGRRGRVLGGLLHRETVTV